MLGRFSYSSVSMIIAFVDYSKTPRSSFCEVMSNYDVVYYSSASIGSTSTYSILLSVTCNFLSIY